MRAFNVFEKFKADLCGAAVGFERDVILVNHYVIVIVDFEEVGQQSYFSVRRLSLLHRSLHHPEVCVFTERSKSQHFSCENIFVLSKLYEIKTTYDKDKSRND